MLRKIIIIVFSFSICTFSNAKNNLPTLDIYANNPEISLMTLSPDGSRIAYRTFQNDREVLLVKEIATGKTLGGTALSGIDAKSAYFIDNFRVILRASEYKKLQGYKGMHNISSAFIYNLKTKEVRQLLIPGYGIYKGQTSLGSIVGLSPDKETAYMPAYYSSDTGYNVYTLMKVNLEKKKKPKQIFIGTHDAVDFFVDENGKPIARERFNDKNNTHRVQSYIDGDWVDIFSETTAYRYRSFSGLTPDKKSLVMTTTGENGRRQYFTMSLKDGTISEPIFNRDDADVEQVLTDIQRVVYGVRYSGFKPSYAFFDEQLTQNFRVIQSAMPESSFSLVDHTPNWSKMIFKLEGGEQAGEYIMFANNSFSFLAASRPQVSADIVNPVSEYSYKARDGLNIPTLLTYPKGKAKQKLPAVVMPHGGPESYDRIQFDWLAQYLASRGVLVIQPQFRGSKGFGIDHLAKGRGEWGKKIQNDITDAVTTLSKANIIDPKRVCIFGWSYGGYAALAGATFTPDLYQCAISINGISDVETMLDFEKREHGKHSETYSYWQEVINKNGKDADFIKNISPINYVDNVQIPILLIHGQRDKVVDFEQSDDFYDALEDADKDVKLIELKGEGHYLLKNESRIKALTAIDTFLNKHLL
ncbi:S9 family peptidase [Colwellia sp. 6M3]|uniref:prolyl oligopeptidase family serine peptidase n=1 Tax=Colwellia sp. 6M3 TaxID=2759849 RepID=UPI0015F5AAE0|nr:prolyl oligopeptidase family serine peptidase [Colwellia sp. 6M3]MBA6417120.1 S9 family peptidase [Colwellia sp. 6M3]